LKNSTLSGCILARLHIVEKQWRFVASDDDLKRKRWEYSSTCGSIHSKIVRGVMDVIRQNYDIRHMQTVCR